MMRSCAWLAFLVLGGCAVTDTGNPPLTPPDPDRVHSVSIFAGTVTLNGEPGAIEDAGSTLRITNLDSMADPVEAIVAADGSFTISLAADVGNVLRLVVVHDDQRSPPLDVSADPIAAIVHPLTCLVLDPMLEVDLGAIEAPVERSVAVQNDCAEPVALSAHARRDTASLVLSALVEPTMLAPGNPALITVHAEPNGPGPHEEILLIEASASVADRFALTVRAQ